MILSLAPFMTAAAPWFALCTGAAHDPVAALLLCTPSIGFADLSVINGQIIVQDGAFCNLDLKVQPAICSPATKHCFYLRRTLCLLKTRLALADCFCPAHTQVHHVPCH